MISTLNLIPVNSERFLFGDLAQTGVTQEQKAG